MHFYTYKITNLLNGKIYIGVHKTSNLEDGYMGSGKALKNAIAKYGVENFKKDILMFHESEDDMFEIEALIVDQEFVDRKDTYNIKLGGFGGFDYINSKMNSDKQYRDIVYGKIATALKATYASNGHPWTGRTHKPETIEKVKNTFAKINHQQGEKNSQFGKMWIHSLELRKSTRINKNDPIPEGWNKGRKMFKE